MWVILFLNFLCDKVVCNYYDLDESFIPPSHLISSVNTTHLMGTQRI